LIEAKELEGGCTGNWFVWSWGNQKVCFGPGVTVKVWALNFWRQIWVEGCVWEGWTELVDPQRGECKGEVQAPTKSKLCCQATLIQVCFRASTLAWFKSCVMLL
jgi:hypothetical protein